jgi:hypothetical protein
MSKTRNETAGGFTAGERDYIRRELDMFFSTLPRVADGFQLKTWRGGPLAGQPKVHPRPRGVCSTGACCVWMTDANRRWRSLPRLASRRCAP